MISLICFFFILITILIIVYFRDINYKKIISLIKDSNNKNNFNNSISTNK